MNSLKNLLKTFHFGYTVYNRGIKDYILLENCLDLFLDFTRNVIIEVDIVIKI